ncbi:HAD family hydrolase [Actinophytocola xinjiangensis]|uniref:HAD family hydrolase n=1 Tax=Actinophytocola xinjiangensis TaxID=485602 RepID=A0A7Z1AUP2_9PSEU|nr:HAD-IIA family hydrolase [Actinophytocola xinjiangensis]OLF04747.1 HAD family hydrolase [Actinophytocola xinjiangensis]
MSLLERYDALLFDLDGTVYRGEQAIDSAPDAVAAAHRAGVTVRFVTNNASRGPDEVARHLTDIGIPAEPAEVSTSAQAAAKVLADNLADNDNGNGNGTVLVLGSPALEREVELVGLRHTRTAGDDVVAVVQGLSKDLGWRDLAEACVALNAGAFWVACNVDPSLPTERGLLPGNGSLVAALRTATGREPVVAGKPAIPLMAEALRSAGTDRALAIGDRLDTDIDGAVAAGLDSLLVLSGVTTAAGLLAARTRPTYLAADVAAIGEPARRLAVGAQPDWDLDGDTIVHRGTGEPDALSLLRVLAAGEPGRRAVPGDDAARAALAHLGLPDGLA